MSKGLIMPTLPRSHKDDNRYHKDDIKKLIASLVVSVTGRTDIEIMIATGDTRSVADKLYLSELKSTKPNDITLWRGHIDRAIFKIAYHDAVCENKFRPSQPDASMLFSYLMRLRYELKGIDNFPGALSNLRAVYHTAQIDWDSNEGRGLRYVLNFLRPELCDNQKQENNNIQNNDKNTKAINAYLDTIKTSYPNPIHEYARIVADFAVFLCNNCEVKTADVRTQITVDEYYQETPTQHSDNTLSMDDNSQEKFSASSEGADDADICSDDPLCGDTPEAFQQNDNSQEGVFLREDFMSETVFNNLFQKTDYRVYKDDYDIEINAEKLVSSAEITQLIKEFSTAQKNHGKTIQKLARKLRSRLVSVQNDCRYYDLYQGTLDHQKITKILLEPLDGRFFKDEIPIIAENTAITLLIDNSGSMRGKPITMAALCADIIAETAQRCGAKVEILGFTTQNWRGGLSRKDYEKAGCPPMPGRLNDLYHIIYKDFNASYKSTKRSIPVMLKESILKENIDGEALQWAVKRLSQRPEPRKILTVISDGAPVDDSTNSANESYFLENHLKKVIHYYENKSDIDVFAIGIGHDVKNYYKKAVTIPNSDALAEALTEKFITLF
jgi:cobaltochelatase CobT